MFLATPLVILILALTAGGTAALVESGDSEVEPATAASAPEPEGEDQVLASFERELAHEPGPVPAAGREAVEHDELYRLVNEPHWTGEAQNSLAFDELQAGGDHEAE